MRRVADAFVMVAMEIRFAQNTVVARASYFRPYRRILERASWKAILQLVSTSLLRARVSKTLSSMTCRFSLSDLVQARVGFDDWIFVTDSETIRTVINNRTNPFPRHPLMKKMAHPVNLSLSEDLMKSSVFR